MTKLLKIVVQIRKQHIYFSCKITEIGPLLAVPRGRLVGAPLPWVESLPSLLHLATSALRSCTTNRSRSEYCCCRLPKHCKLAPSPSMSTKCRDNLAYCKFSSQTEYSPPGRRLHVGQRCEPCDCAARNLPHTPRCKPPSYPIPKHCN